ncbi:MAG: hypothetical protein AABW89_03695 [Nanoarchaeota archaeon]
MSKIVLEGRLKDLDLVLIPLNLKDGNGFIRRNVGYEGTLKFAIQQDGEVSKTKNMPLHVSNEFEARLISTGLEGQRVVYSEEVIEMRDGTGYFSSKTLEVRSGQYEGVKFNAKS